MLSNAKDILEWHVAVGADEVITDEPVNRLKPPVHTMAEAAKQSKVIENNMTMQTRATELQMPKASDDNAPPLGTIEVVQTAQRLAKACNTLEELRAAVTSFEDCPLKRTASKTVFDAGNPKARVMCIGDAPDAIEDQKGVPFTGEAGQLLDKIFASIDMTRDTEESDKAVYFTNLVYWRPPSNRPASDSEIEICRPFVERHIEIINPDFIILLGGVTAKVLLRTSKGITRLRGKWTELTLEGLEAPISVLPMLHPDFLLKSPTRKREMWHDILSLQAKLAV